MSEIRVDTISEKTSANGVAVDGVTIKDGGIAATAASTITTADNLDTLSLVSTDTDAVIGPNLNLYRNAGNGADADVIASIAFAGNDDAGNATDFARITAQIDDASNGSEDVYFDFRTMVAGSERKRMSLVAAETVFNEDSVDLDFRVESNGNANMLFVDGENNRVGIGSNPDLGVGLHIKSADSGASANADADELVVEGSGHSGLSILSATGDSGRICFGDSGDDNIGQIIYQHGSNSLHFNTNGTEACTIDTNGNFTRHQTGAVSIRIGSTNAGGAFLLLDGDSNGDFTGSDYSYIAHDSAGRLEIFQDSPSGTNQIRFHTAAVERMRINDSEVAIGTTSFSGKITTLQNASGRTSAFFEHNGDNSSAYPAGVVSKFTTDVNSSARSLYEGYGSSTRRFAVYASGTVANSTGSYGSLSDQRIKTNITDASSQWDDIKAIKVRNFKKIDNPDLVQIGVVAQELESVSSKLIEETQPDATIIAHDATFGTLYTADDAETQDAIEQVLYTADDQEVIDGAKNVGDIKIAAELSTKQIGDVKEIKEQVKSVKYSVLYMKAIKALQEAMTRIETLEAEVTALKG